MNIDKIREKLKKRSLDTQISLRINADQLKWLQAYAKDLDVSVNRLILVILEQFREESKK